MGEARGRGVGRWGTEVRGAAASANYEDNALPATVPSILIARAKVKVNSLSRDAPSTIQTNRGARPGVGGNAVKCSKFLFLLSTVASVGTLTAATSAGAATCQSLASLTLPNITITAAADDSRRQLHRGERPDFRTYRPSAV